MTSNFLGDVEEMGGARAPSFIISGNELIAREGVDLQKGMNFRDGGEQLSVLLVLPRGGAYKDEWHEDTQIYDYVGHDSTTVESGKSIDQLLMYESGKLSDNGKFFKTAKAFADGSRREPLQVQVYEKLDAGVFYDKGIFNLIDAVQVNEDGRNVFKFSLTLADADFYAPDDPDTKERMLPAATKLEIWQRCRGRCVECETERGLHMVHVDGTGMELRCTLHGGGRSVGLL